MSGEKKNRKDIQGRYGFWMWISLLLVLAVAVALLAVSCGKSTENAPVPESKIMRRALPAGPVRETAYYTDKLGWLKENDSAAIKGMAYFYEQTGVQPHLYLTTQIGGSLRPTMEEMQEYAELLYDGLFNDQAHLLLLVCVSDEKKQEYLSWCEAGSAAEAVADEEARTLLREYWDRAFRSAASVGEGRKGPMVAEVFRNTADNIMHVRTGGGWINLLVLIIAAMLFVILFGFVRGRITAPGKEKQVKKA